MSSADYDDMIRSSAKRFLTTFPESEHVAEVEAIIKQLEEEKEKVQLGAIKLDGEWISREDRQLYRFAVEARIRHLRMKQKMANNDLLGALREFEKIDVSYQETPAHAGALGSALKLLPGWTQTLERQLNNVKFLNERDKAGSDRLKPDELAQIEKAQAEEQARFQQALKSEEDQGILWKSVNFRSADSLQNGIGLAKSQLARLSEIDAAALNAKADLLNEANRLIGEGSLSAARSKIADATGIGSSSKKKRSSSKSKKSTTATRYSQWLLAQISEKQQALEDAAVAAANAKKNDAAAIASAEGSEKGDADDKPETTDGKGEDETKEGDEKAEDKPMTRAEIVAAERARNEAKKAAEGSDKDDDDKSKPKKPTTKKSSSDKDEDEDEDKPKAKSSGGGFHPKYIVWIISGLLIVTVVVLKVTGIGGNK